MKREEITKLFNLRKSDSVKNHKGEVIKFNVLDDRTDGSEAFLPERNDAYIFSAEELIDVGIALDENIPVYLWGLHGSGKSTLPEQVACRTNRPAVRLQHSVSTEEADILGQWALKPGETVFNLGPLPTAMLQGLVYIADEYDFALPNVLAIYQAVLEGEALFIKGAPPELRLIKPHPDFRFVATGNTNGSGDETGLYQGTQIQNAANYSRFGITINMGYSKYEKEIINSTLGEIPEDDMAKLMEFTKLVREGYYKKTITNTISTRELLAITKLAILRGRSKLNFKYGVDRGFVARMSSLDAAAISKISDRVFG